ncbi:protein FAM185A isoform X2 [Polyodon spathula]|uniref:protein FAM185A isoform X2 n=1 Tax=Polyodon spathula TaxID=7913 RepID=UPI001B7EF09F|nr:protein FAM185A isoform X2 [Polyodon spathula]
MIVAVTKSLYRGLCVEMVCWKALTGCKTTNCFPYALPLQSFRGLSTTRCFRELNKPLKQWTLIVNPFTFVKVQLPCNVSVRPLDPHIFPKADRAFVTVNGTSADQGLKLDNFHVKYDEKSKELVILSEKVNSNVSVEVMAPIKCDLDIKTLGEGNVKIQKMECENCSVRTERGHSVLQSIKAHKVLVHSKEGNIICLGTIHGNVDVHASRNSLVQITKLQGTRMSISTEHGPLKAKYIYAESSSVSSTSGQIELGNVHDGSDGCLKASTNAGDIDAYISQFGTAELYSQQGAISVRVPVSIKADVRLSGSAVDISPEIPLQEDDTFSEDGHTTLTAHLNGKAEGNNWIKAHAAKGTVSLKSQSWFESLKIGKV